MDKTELDRACRATHAYLRQDKIWVPKDGKVVEIGSMDPEWRYNASRLLERRAVSLELHYSIGELNMLGARTMQAVVGVNDDGDPVEGGPWLSHLDLMGEHAQDAFDAELAQRCEDPVAWLWRTPLYQALVRGLPTHPADLETLAQRAKHYNWCLIRAGENTCTCAIQADDDDA